MDKATMRAAHPDIAELIDQIRAKGGGIAGLRIGDQTWGDFQEDDYRTVWVELTDAHMEMMRNDGHVLPTKAVMARRAKKRG